MSNEGPLLLIISSPSGAGKTTLTTRLLKAIDGLLFSVSHTTRRPRPGEHEGREYYFVERPEFMLLEKGDGFLEWAEVHGNLYGTSRSELARGSGARGVIFDVDHQGARQIKSRRPDAVSVFVLPPSMDELLRRLRGRASDDEATVLARFNVARHEIEHYGAFDYVLVNDDIDTATEQLLGVFRAEECRRDRAARHAERLLTEGRAIADPRD